MDRVRKQKLRKETGSANRRLVIKPDDKKIRGLWTDNEEPGVIRSDRLLPERANLSEEIPKENTMENLEKAFDRSSIARTLIDEARKNGSEIRFFKPGEMDEFFSRFPSIFLLTGGDFSGISGDFDNDGDKDVFINPYTSNFTDCFKTAVHEAAHSLTDAPNTYGQEITVTQLENAAALQAGLQDRVIADEDLLQYFTSDKRYDTVSRDINDYKECLRDLKTVLPDLAEILKPSFELDPPVLISDDEARKYMSADAFNIYRDSDRYSSIYDKEL